ncbi:MAG: sodium/pantothenate symporter [Clostridia bacterium]|jgi:sodium/pantothenate symporter|nr:sodium/pantothenate symporter [Clostridia bacterium]MCI2001200.1 sodium/pantothenate symporter [Clostridia bacterium]MCI2015890.1 sodium/pantothenate symporter [Clostridia bacterium]
MNAFLRLSPVFVFFVILLGLGFYIQKTSADARAKNYSKDYYIGGRSLGGFVLAMTLVATYSSVSSFLSGPGVAWQKGFGWVYFASTQVVAAFIVLGVLGKKMAVIGRRTDSVTVVDVIRQRYQSNTLAIISAVVIIVFFTTTMLGQFIGGAQIFSATTGLSYKAGLIFFAFVVVLYTTVGGFNAVAITDTACAVVMLIGMFCLGYAIISKGGGINKIMATITEVSKTATATGKGFNMLSPTAESSGVASIPVQLFITQWMLCGVCTLGLPQSNVRCLSYKDTKSVHSAMLYGTIVVGAMMVGMHMLGVLSRGVLFEINGSTDTVIPTLITNYMNPFLAGITIIGPLAATMSTISSLLIAGSSAIVKDIYMHSKEAKGEEINQKKVGRISLTVTAIMGIVAVCLAIKPPDIIVWINMFAFGGLQTAFFWTLVLGLFWKKANATGAIWGMIGGLAAYCITMALGIKVSTFHNIIIGIVCALIFFIIGTNVGKPVDEKVGRLFFPEKY